MKPTRDHRQDKRFQVQREAFVEIGSRSLSVSVVNVSAGGAFIEFYRAPSPPPRSFRLVFIGRTAATAMDVSATFVHGGSKGWGVRFDEPLPRHDFAGYLTAPTQLASSVEAS